PPKVRSPRRGTDRALARSASTAAVHTRRRGAAGTRAIPAAASTARRPRAMPPSVTMIPTITRATVVWPARQASRTMPSAHGAMTAAAATPAPPKRQPAIRPAGHPQAVSVRSGETASPRRREARAGSGLDPSVSTVSTAAASAAAMKLVASTRTGDDRVISISRRGCARASRLTPGRLPDHRDGCHADPGGAAEHQHLGPGDEGPGHVRFPHLQGQAHRAGVAEALDRAPDLRAGIPLGAEVRHPALDEALRGLVAEDEVQLLVAPPGALHRRGEGGRHHLEPDREEVPPVAQERHVHQGPAYLTGLRARPRPARDREPPLGGVAPELSLAEPALWVGARLHECRPPSVAEDEAGNRVHALLDRTRLPRRARGGGRKLARVDVGVGPPPLAHAGHPLQPSPLEPEPPDPSPLLDLGTGHDPGGYLGTHAGDAGAEHVLPAATDRRRHDFTISFLAAR